MDYPQPIDPLPYPPTNQERNDDESPTVQTLSSRPPANQDAVWPTSGDDPQYVAYSELGILLGQNTGYNVSIHGNPEGMDASQSDPHRQGIQQPPPYPVLDFTELHNLLPLSDLAATGGLVPWSENRNSTTQCDGQSTQAHPSKHSSNPEITSLQLLPFTPAEYIQASSHTEWHESYPNTAFDEDHRSQNMGAISSKNEMATGSTSSRIVPSPQGELSAHDGKSGELPRRGGLWDLGDSPHNNTEYPVYTIKSKSSSAALDPGDIRRR
ncbi:hypothetical protein FRC00_003181 [Tulasnella sp. 408]|nr:hypothetical protein FRC00_003181 [Tulasnella sp. 408]